MAFQPLMSLLDDSSAEMEMFTGPISDLLTYLRRSENVLMIPSSVLAGWLLPETIQTQSDDVLFLDSVIYSAELWNEKNSTWNHNRIMAFVQIDFDFCLLDVTVPTGSLSFHVLSRESDGSRFWNQTPLYPLDANLSNHYHSLCDAVCNWLSISSMGHFKPIGDSVLHCNLVDDPLLEVLKHILIKFALFPDVNYSLMMDRNSLLKRLQDEAQFLTQLARMEAEDALEEVEFNAPETEVFLPKDLNVYRVTIRRPLPFHEWTGWFNASSAMTEFDIPEMTWALLDKFVKNSKKITLKSAVIIALFLVGGEFLSNDELTLLVLKLKLVPADSKIYRTNSNMQCLFAGDGLIYSTKIQKSATPDAAPRKRRARTDQDPAKMLFASDTIKNSDGRPITVRALSPKCGFDAARHLLGLADGGIPLSSLSVDVEKLCLIIQTIGPSCTSDIKQYFTTGRHAGLDDDKVTHVLYAAVRVARQMKFIEVDGYVPHPRGKTIARYRLAASVIAKPSDTFELQEKLKPMFEASPILSLSECALACPTASTQLLEVALNDLVANQHLFKLVNPVSNAHTLYILTGKGTTEFKPKLEFEYFYKLLNITVLDEETRRSVALNRIAVHKAFESRRVYSDPEVFTSHEFVEADCTTPNPFLSVRPNIGELAFLGNGLFAEADLPAGFLLPITGVVTPDTDLLKESFFPYGFKFEGKWDNEETLLVMNTQPISGGPVTCLAGYANDPRGTGLSANANTISSHFENRLYLELITPVKQNEQIFWSYGDDYWQGESSSEPLTPLLESTGDDSVFAGLETNILETPHCLFDPHILLPLQTEMDFPFLYAY